MELVPAFAMEEVSWDAKLTESHIYFDPNYVEGQNRVFYPAIDERVDFSLSNPLKVAPQGFYLYGELWLDSTNQDFIRNIIPIRILSGLK